jgi:sugar lactone lactonase YvrE
LSAKSVARTDAACRLRSALQHPAEASGHFPHHSGRLIRFDPSGVVDRIVGLPVNSTTSLTFGGPDLDVAYVTSMARPYGCRYHAEREAGFVFAVHDLGVRGLPELRFKG